MTSMAPSSSPADPQGSKGSKPVVPKSNSAGSLSSSSPRIADPVTTGSVPAPAVDDGSRLHLIRRYPTTNRGVAIEVQWEIPSILVEAMTMGSASATPTPHGESAAQCLTSPELDVYGLHFQLCLGLSHLEKKNLSAATVSHQAEGGKYFGIYIQVIENHDDVPQGKKEEPSNGSFEEVPCSTMWERTVSYQFEFVPPSCINNATPTSAIGMPQQHNSGMKFPAPCRKTHRRIAESLLSHARLVVGFRDFLQEDSLLKEYAHLVGDEPDEVGSNVNGVVSNSRSNVTVETGTMGPYVLLSACMSVHHSPQVFLNKMKNSAERSRASYGVVGLRNHGATCYMNVLLQVLFHISFFRNEVYKLRAMNGKRSLVATLLQKLFHELDTLSTPVSTLAFLNAMHASPSQQQDAHEYLSEFFLQRVLKHATDLFSISVKYVTKCTKVEFTSFQEQSLYELPICVAGSHTVEDGIAKELSAEPLSDLYDTGNPKFGKQPAVRQLQIVKCPPILFINARRFDAYSRKIHEPQSLSDRLTVAGERYTLYAVVIHHGIGINSGHYTVFIRLQPKQFFLFDDEAVTPVSDEDVFVHSIGTHWISPGSSAYIIVYIQDAVYEGAMSHFEKCPAELVAYLRRHDAVVAAAEAKKKQLLDQRQRQLIVNSTQKSETVNTKGANEELKGEIEGKRESKVSRQDLLPSDERTLKSLKPPPLRYLINPYILALFSRDFLVRTYRQVLSASASSGISGSSFSNPMTINDYGTTPDCTPIRGGMSPNSRQPQPMVAITVFRLSTLHQYQRYLGGIGYDFFQEDLMSEYKKRRQKEERTMNKAGTRDNSGKRRFLVPFQLHLPVSTTIAELRRRITKKIQQNEKNNDNSFTYYHQYLLCPRENGTQRPSYPLYDEKDTEEDLGMNTHSHLEDSPSTAFASPPRSELSGNISTLSAMRRVNEERRILRTDVPPNTTTDSLGASTPRSLQDVLYTFDAPRRLSMKILVISHEELARNTTIPAFHHLPPVPISRTATHCPSLQPEQLLSQQLNSSANPPSATSNMEVSPITPSSQLLSIQARNKKPSSNITAQLISSVELSPLSEDGGNINEFSPTQHKPQQEGEGWAPNSSGTVFDYSQGVTLGIKIYASNGGLFLLGVKFFSWQLTNLASIVHCVLSELHGSVKAMRENNPKKKAGLSAIQEAVSTAFQLLGPRTVEEELSLLIRIYEEVRPERLDRLHCEKLQSVEIRQLELSHGDILVLDLSDFLVAVNQQLQQQQDEEDIKTGKNNTQEQQLELVEMNAKKMQERVDLVSYYYLSAANVCLQLCNLVCVEGPISCGEWSFLHAGSTIFLVVNLLKDNLQTLELKLYRELCKRFKLRGDGGKREKDAMEGDEEGEDEGVFPPSQPLFTVTLWSSKTVPLPSPATFPSALIGGNMVERHLVGVPFFKETVQAATNFMEKKAVATQHCEDNIGRSTSLLSFFYPTPMTTMLQWHTEAVMPPVSSPASPKKQQTNGVPESEGIDRAIGTLQHDNDVQVPKDHRVYIGNMNRRLYFDVEPVIRKIDGEESEEEASEEESLSQQVEEKSSAALKTVNMGSDENDGVMVKEAPDALQKLAKGASAGKDSILLDYEDARMINRKNTKQAPGGEYPKKIINKDLSKGGCNTKLLLKPRLPPRNAYVKKITLYWMSDHISQKESIITVENIPGRTPIALLIAVAAQKLGFFELNKIPTLVEAASTSLESLRQDESAIVNLEGSTRSDRAQHFILSSPAVVQNPTTRVLSGFQRRRRSYFEPHVLLSMLMLVLERKKVIEAVIPYCPMEIQDDGEEFSIQEKHRHHQKKKKDENDPAKQHHHLVTVADLVHQSQVGGMMKLRLEVSPVLLRYMLDDDILERRKALVQERLASSTSYPEGQRRSQQGGGIIPAISLSQSFLTSNHCLFACSRIQIGTGLLINTPFLVPQTLTFQELMESLAGLQVVSSHAEASRTEDPSSVSNQNRNDDNKLFCVEEDEENNSGECFSRDHSETTKKNDERKKKKQSKWRIALPNIMHQTGQEDSQQPLLSLCNNVVTDFSLSAWSCFALGNEDEIHRQWMEVSNEITYRHALAMLHTFFDQHQENPIPSAVGQEGESFSSKNCNNANIFYLTEKKRSHIRMRQGGSNDTNPMLGTQKQQLLSAEELNMDLAFLASHPTPFVIPLVIFE